MWDSVNKREVLTLKKMQTFINEIEEIGDSKEVIDLKVRINNLMDFEAGKRCASSDEIN